MFPFINLGFAHVGTFGLLLWLAAVCATVVLHRNFVRHGVNGDALNTVAFTVVAGILGAKAWHELQYPHQLALAWREILLPGWHHPGDVLVGFLHWFQAGFAWYGGLLAGVATLLWQGRHMRPNGLRREKAMLRLLDLAAPAAAIGYGVGRLGCLTSGDGDYGKVTTLPWGVHMAPNALVPPTPPDALVQPTPLYEFAVALVLAGWLWKRGEQTLPLGWLTGEYLVLSGVARFAVEFARINPHVYGPLTNAQVASVLSAAVGGWLMWRSRKKAATGHSAVAENRPAAA